MDGEDNKILIILNINMLLPQSKQAIKPIKDGYHRAAILSISETIGYITIKFKTISGQIQTSLPINDSLHSFLCKLGHLAGIRGKINLYDLVGREIDIEVKNKKVIAAYKLGQSKLIQTIKT